MSFENILKILNFVPLNIFLSKVNLKYDEKFTSTVFIRYIGELPTLSQKEKTYPVVKLVNNAIKKLFEIDPQNILCAGMQIPEYALIHLKVST